MTRATIALMATLSTGGISVLYCQNTGSNGYVTGRTPDGEPDLRGIWEAEGSANWNLEGHPALKGVPAAKSVIIEPGDGKLPYQASALAKRKSMKPADDPQSKCFLAGVPRITYTPGPFQIFQSAGLVAIVYQDLHTFRYIPTIPASRPEDLEFWMGSPQGRWEGDDLLVDSNSFNDQTWFDKAGNFHSEGLHVIERFRRVGPNKMFYEAEIEDPKVFTRPWKMLLTLKRHAERGFRIAEDECLEDQQGRLYHYISGAH